MEVVWQARLAQMTHGYGEITIGSENIDTTWKNDIKYLCIQNES